MNAPIFWATAAQRGMLAAMRNHAWLVVPLLFFVGGCEKEKAASESPPPVVSIASEAVETPKREAVEDVDIKGLLKKFGCHDKANKAICDVLDGFDKGKKWEPTSIQGNEGRYFGKAVTNTKGVRKERWVFLIIKKVPLNEIADGDLSVKVAFRELDKDKVAENNHAPKLLWLLQRDDAIPKRNQTANHVLGYAPSNWDSASPTQGTSIILHVDDGIYVRQGEDRSLQLIKTELATPGSASTDETYVRLYPLSW